MQPNGYKTSSTKILEIIEQEGVDIFEVLRIDTNLDGLSAYDYESLFLQTIDCANSHDWYNGHNNSGISFGTQEFENSMLEKYNVINPSQIDYVRDIISDNMKGRSKFLIEHGIHRFQSSEFQKNVQLNLVAEGKHNFAGKSDKATERNMKRVKDGTHPFLGGDIQRTMNMARVEDGTHPFLGGNIQRKTQRKLVAEGKHHSQTEKHSVDQSKRQLELVAEGKHHFQSGSIQSIHNKMMTSRQLYLDVKLLFESLSMVKPKCLHRKSNDWLDSKYKELISIQECQNECA